MAMLDHRYLWVNGLGDDWLRRNRPDLGKNELVLPAIERLKLNPTFVLEVGSSNGWRLQKIKDTYGCRVIGVDPSVEAVQEANAAGIQTLRATADYLPFASETFDLLIFGFCLCFIAPHEWPALVFESIRVLKDGGHLIIMDFVCSKYTKRPMRMAKIEDGTEHPIYIFHNNWPSLWLAYPGFKMVDERFNLSRGEVLSVMKKDFLSLLKEE